MEVTSPYGALSSLSRSALRCVYELANLNLLWTAAPWLLQAKVDLF